MTAPSQQVLLETVDLYTHFREDLWNSPIEVLKSGIKSGINALSSLIYGKSNDLSKKEVCEVLKESIKTAAITNTPEAWFDLVFKLIEAGNAAQDVISKQFSVGQSLLCATCYGMANYIVRSLMQGEDELSVGFRAKVTALIKQKQETVALIENRRKNDNSEGVTGLKKELAAITLKLAYLFDSTSIFEAIDKNLLTHLDPLVLGEEERLHIQSTYGLGVNEEQAYCLQDNSYEIMFVRHYQQLGKLTPHEFIAKAMEKEVTAKVVKQQVSKGHGQIPLPTPPNAFSPLKSIDDEFDAFLKEPPKGDAPAAQPDAHDADDPRDNELSQQTDVSHPEKPAEGLGNLEDNQDEEATSVKSDRHTPPEIVTPLSMFNDKQAASQREAAASLEEQQKKGQRTRRHGKGGGS